MLCTPSFRIWIVFSNLPSLLQWLEPRCRCRCLCEVCSKSSPILLGWLSVGPSALAVCTIWREIGFRSNPHSAMLCKESTMPLLARHPSPLRLQVLCSTGAERLKSLSGGWMTSGRPAPLRGKRGPPSKTPEKFAQSLEKPTSL